MTRLDLNRWSRPPRKPHDPWATQRGNEGQGFICPKCGGGKCLVLDSRPPANPTQGWKRRRQCGNTACNHRFTTREVVEGAPVLDRAGMKAILSAIVALLENALKTLRKAVKDLEQDS